MKTRIAVISLTGLPAKQEKKVSKVSGITRDNKSGIISLFSAPVTIGLIIWFILKGEF
ncbi:hypothetical protein [uncultured Algoriphagus sp.]|uniref:hypothetical protein n=1 Tax=uncultured Algoriphagus sp. TaxID=417365 RepID=UPI0030ED8647